jgi:hypothetical protein
MRDENSLGQNIWQPIDTCYRHSVVESASGTDTGGDRHFDADAVAARISTLRMRRKKDA